MMTVYAGGLGQGKTLGMVAKARQLKLANPNMDLYANFPNNIGAKLIRRWSELEQLRNAIVLIDEGHKVFDSRNYKDNVKKTHFALLSRHFDLIILIATQVLDQIDLRIRRVVDYLVICEKKKDRQGKRYFVYHQMKASPFVTGSFTIGRKKILTRPELYYGLYDTKGTITELQ